jgi:hypothetical protein
MSDLFDDRNASREAIIARLTGPHCPEGRCLAHKLIGGHEIWLVVERDKKRRIVLFLLSDDRCTPIYESEGPTWYSCPLEFLLMAHPADSDFGREWRNEMQHFVLSN